MIDSTDLVVRQIETDLDPQRPSPSGNDQASAQATLGQSLRPVRIVLSIAFVVVVLIGPGQSVVSLSRGMAAVLAVVGVVNALVNTGRMLGVVRDTTSRSSWWLQIGADAMLALTTGMLLLDASATPLAWVALLLPVFDAAVAFGALGAGLSWAALSLAYVFFRLQVEPAGTSDSDVLGLALQQLAAVAVVAIPTAYVGARLRDDLAVSHRARLDANRRAEELLLVAAAAERLASTTDADEVLEIALDCVASLGFARADVCEKTGDRPWRLLRAAGTHPTPALDGRLDAVLEPSDANGSPAVRGPVADEELRLLGYHAGAIRPIAASSGRRIVIRGWSAEGLAVAAGTLESFNLVASLTAGAWQNAATLSDLESWSAELTHRATHDELTGLANRPYLFTHVESSLERMRSTGVRFAALFLDLDGFKEVNDALGHDAGDAVLQAVAERLGQKVRGHDLLARLGGDEFVVVLNDLADPGQATAIATRICETAAAPFSIGDNIVTLGASVGVAYAEPGDTADTVLTNADRVMYEAKRQGGNRFVVSNRLSA